MALWALHDHIWPGHLSQTLSSWPGQTRIPTFCWCDLILLSLVSNTNLWFSVSSFPDLLCARNGWDLGDSLCSAQNTNVKAFYPQSESEVLLAKKVDEWRVDIRKMHFFGLAKSNMNISSLPNFLISNYVRLPWCKLMTAPWLSQTGPSDGTGR